MADLEAYRKIKEEAEKHKATIVAVSKKKPASEINQLLAAGQTIFGENYVQELLQKQKEIPKVQWHFIGHLQTNKVKQVVPIVSMIQSIDSLKILQEVDKQSDAANVKSNCLIEVFIASEETKTGFSVNEASTLFDNNQFADFPNVNVCGFMGMASNTEDDNLIRSEFKSLRKLFEKYKSESFHVLSMGMTSDYRIALEEGSTMIRIGSAIFGSRI
jgi:pyridoxal phosphate enzyme (YggS family)